MIIKEGRWRAMKYKPKYKWPTSFDVLYNWLLHDIIIHYYDATE